MKRLYVAFLALLSLALSSGCATFEHTKAAPAQRQPIAVKVSGEELSNWSDLPIGVYRIPDSQVVVSGHQKGAAAGMMFGLLGVAIAHSANASAGAQATSNVEDKLRIKLNSEVESIIKQFLNSDQFKERFATDNIAAPPTLLVTPGLVLSYVSDVNIRPFVVLKTQLVDVNKTPLWATRYISSSGPARPLAGENSWTENDSAALKASIRKSLEQGLTVMLADVTKPFLRDETKLTSVETHFPYIKSRLQTVGYKLNEDDRVIVFIPRVGDVVVFSGVNVLEKDGLIYRDATKDDAILKIVQ